MGVCSATSKCVLVVINILFWVAAAFMLYAGISYIHSAHDVLNEVHNKPAIVTFGIAALLFFCGLVGIAGAFSEKKPLLGVFAFVIVATFTMLVYVSAILFIQRDNAMNQTDAYVLKEFENYGNPNLTAHEYEDAIVKRAALALTETTTPPAGGNSTTVPTTPAPSNTTTAAMSTTTVAPTTTPQASTNATSFVDKIQENLDCCGYDSYTDYKSYVHWHPSDSVPNSCCNETALSANQTCPHLLNMKTDKDLIYQKGCGNQVHTVVKFVYDFMSWSAVAFCILVFLGFCSTMFLICRKRRDGFNYESIVA